MRRILYSIRLILSLGDEKAPVDFFKVILLKVNVFAPSFSKGLERPLRRLPAISLSRGRQAPGAVRAVRRNETK
jgi:hypothetical protein